MTVLYNGFFPCEVWTINAERKWHHMKRSKAVKPIVTYVSLTIRNSIHRGELAPITVPVEALFRPVQDHTKGGTLADTANQIPPCKAVLDGVVKGGLLPDDTPEWVVFQGFYPPIKGPPGVCLILRVPDE